MGFRLAVSRGAENISLDERTIEKVSFGSDSATDSNARATDFGIAVKITGKMLYKVGADGDDGTLGLAKWSQVPSEQADCYRSAKIDVVSAGQVVREYTMRLSWNIKSIWTMKPAWVLSTCILSRRRTKMMR